MDAVNSVNKESQNNNNYINVDVLLSNYYVKNFDAEFFGKIYSIIYLKEIYLNYKYKSYLINKRHNKYYHTLNLFLGKANIISNIFHFL